MAYFISPTMIGKKVLPAPLLKVPPPVNQELLTRTRSRQNWSERESLFSLPQAAGAHLCKQWVYSLDCGNFL